MREKKDNAFHIWLISQKEINGHTQEHAFSPDIEQGFGFMHLYIADGTIFAGFQVTHNAHFTDCNREKNLQYEWMHQKRISWVPNVGQGTNTKVSLTRMEALDDCGCIYKVSSTKDAYEVRVELGDLYPGGSMHVGWTLQKKSRNPAWGEQ